ncbi:dihydroorotase [Serratia symbiotica str. 'Cinara cedri']|nr:dihydroorotase [Serratia symbiotica str. 'Cinara cedri']
MTAQLQALKIRRPDDWHIHLRDGKMLKIVAPYTSHVFGRAMVMPNLTPPITTMSSARSYRQRILAATQQNDNFNPLMTCYLTNYLSVDELVSGFKQSVFTAAKLYPANTTTNSSYGVSNIKSIYSLFENMQKIGMPLLIHGEITNTTIDIFDREARFIEQVLHPMRQHFPELKIVFEHITTKEAVQYVQSGNQFLGATITPQHLMFNRNHMLAQGIRPHLFCLPILKRSIHQEALCQAITSGSDRFFLGTDSAPHIKKHKESYCGCAGVFNALNAMPVYTTIFEKLGALQHLEAFCSLNGPRFYGLTVNKDFIELQRVPIIQPTEISSGSESVIPFLAGSLLQWSLKD